MTSQEGEGRSEPLAMAERRTMTDVCSEPCSRSAGGHGGSASSPTLLVLPVVLLILGLVAYPFFYAIWV